MDDSLYSPLLDGLTAQELEEETSFLNAMIASLDPEDPHYAERREHHEQSIRNIDTLFAGLRQSTSPAPGLAYASFSNESPAENSTVGIPGVASSRKRSLDTSNSTGSASAGLPGTPMSIDSLPSLGPNGQSARTFIDLTGIDSDEVSFVNNPTLAPDPFAELFDAFQPGTSTQTNAFNQEWMDQNQLAEFLMTPAPPGNPFMLNQTQEATKVPTLTIPSTPVTPISNLEEELFGDFALPDANPEAVQSLIENIVNHDDIEPAKREPTPKAMRSTLMEHQKIALSWLLMMERGTSKGGILADDMGLGKTVEALALILANPSNNPACKTTLIVAPVALMMQWEKEIERHVRLTRRLSVYIYHGAGKKATFAQLRKFDIVLTTFTTLAYEMKRKENRQESEAIARSQQDSRYVRSGKDTLALVGRECMWYRVILDEAQCIKNRSTYTSKAANDLMSQHRLCMTGTPMMNSTEELFPLIRFLKIPPYHDWGCFNDQIIKPLKSSSLRTRDRGMGRLQVLLKGIMLRRTKTTKVDGKQICEIPPKHTNMQAVEFSEPERELYNAIETKSQLRLNRYLQEGTVTNHYASVLVMLLRLRQICCHPFLIRDLSAQVSTEGIAEEDLMSRTNLLSAEVIKRLSETDGFECPICYEYEANPTIFIPCGHSCCGECFQKLIDPSRAIREGDESGRARCPHCRGTLSSDKITDYEHFCKVFCPERLKDLFGDDTEEGKMDSDVYSDSEDDDDADSLDGFVVDDDHEDTDTDEDSKYKFEKGELRDASKKKSKKKKGKAKAKPKVTLAQLKKDSLKNQSAKRKYLKRLRKTWAGSAKIDKTMELLSEIRAKDPTEKTLIFSQFTSLLDLLEVPLSERRFKYQRYDGSMRMNDRVEAVNQFMDDADENIMLISLKAGNAGLNLNKASQVIILDPFWNPFIEDQAVDRAHRMPQQREVHVHRVLVPETVEDRICALQEKKRDLINTALDEGVGQRLTRLTIGELKYLFGFDRRA